MSVKSKFYRPKKPVTVFEDDVSSGLLHANGGLEQHLTRCKDVTLLKTSRGLTPDILLAALLDLLCSIYEQNTEKHQQLFLDFCQTLTKMGLMCPLAAVDELSTLRSQVKVNLKKAFLLAVNKQISSNKKMLTLDKNVLNMDYRIPHIELMSPSVVRFHTSRYHDEFTELGTVSKGAYGTIFKVRHHLDRCEYAIKKIVLKEANMEVLLKMVREVKVLASLTHNNVVRYFTAWIEYSSSSQHATSILTFPTQPTVKPAIAYTVNSSSGHNGHHSAGRNGQLSMSVSNAAAGDYSESSGGIVFEASANSPSVPTEGIFTENTNVSHNQSNNNDPEHLEGKQFLRQLLHTTVMVLHIQMELCHNTLKDWIQGRNYKCISGADQFQVYKAVNLEETKKIIHQLLEAVSYIHAEGIIHRDIKPKNIFLTHTSLGEVHLKLGDFGLSRDLHPEFLDTNLSSSWEDLAQGPDDVSSWEMYTQGVGTTIYASPEQLQDNIYDQKSDMYSIGLIMFEMLEPFSTEMERIQALKHIRQHEEPPSIFREQWPDFADVIKSLLSFCAAKRPSAAEILESDLFTSKDKVIKNLQIKLTHAEDRVQQLELHVQSQQDELDKLKQFILQHGLDIP